MDGHEIPLIFLESCSAEEKNLNTSLDTLEEPPGASEGEQQMGPDGAEVRRHSGASGTETFGKLPAQTRALVFTPFLSFLERNISFKGVDPAGQSLNRPLTFKLQCSHFASQMGIRQWQEHTL